MTIFKPEADAIAGLVASEFLVAPEQICGQNREPGRVMIARTVLIWLLHETMGANLCAIGRYVGRDRTTVHHHLKRIQRERATQQHRRDQTDRLRAVVQSTGTFLTVESADVRSGALETLVAAREERIAVTRVETARLVAERDAREARELAAAAARRRAVDVPFFEEERRNTAGTYLDQNERFAAAMRAAAGERASS